MANSKKQVSKINPTIIVVIIIIILLLGGIGFLVYRIIKKKEENHVYIDYEEDNYDYEEIPRNLDEPYEYYEKNEEKE